MFEKLFYWPRIQTTLQRMFHNENVLGRFHYVPAQFSKTLTNTWKDNPIFKLKGAGKPHPIAVVCMILAELSSKMPQSDKSYYSIILITVYCLHDNIINSDRYKLQKKDWILIVKAIKIYGDTWGLNAASFQIDLGENVYNQHQKLLTETVEYLEDKAMFSEEELEAI